MNLRHVAWVLGMAIRSSWAHFRSRPVLLSESDTDQTIAMCQMPGFDDIGFALPRHVKALRAALARIRMGVTAETALASLRGVFVVMPSDIVGYDGPCRLVFVHRGAGDYLTAIPWIAPIEALEALSQHLVCACEAIEANGLIEAVFEDDEVAG